MKAFRTVLKWVFCISGSALPFAALTNPIMDYTDGQMKVIMILFLPAVLIMIPGFFIFGVMGLVDFLVPRSSQKEK